MIYNAVYETPCGGKVTGLMRLGSDGVAELLPNASLGGRFVPEEKGWLPMFDLGIFLGGEEQMFEDLNRREGWSLTPA